MKTWQWLVLPACVVAWSCSGTSNDTNQTNSNTQASTCGQTCQDNEVGYGLDKTIWVLWNEYFAGQPSGAQNKTVNCPLGGTAQITGTTGVASNGIDTVHLTLVLQNCANSNTGFSLAFTGTLTWDGSFNGSVGNTLTFKSASLVISGDIALYNNPTVDETCAVSLTDSYDKNSSTQPSWLNGVICGRTVNL
jgi:hypothetical protein